MVQTSIVTAVLVFQHDPAVSVPVEWNPKTDVWMHEQLLKARPYCPCEWMDSEDT